MGFPFFANIPNELGIEDSNATGSASNRGNPVGHVLLVGTESNERGNLLKAPTYNPPQIKPPSPCSCHRGWAMGRGRVMRREEEKNFAINVQNQHRSHFPTYYFKQ